ncbi:MAG: RICIN domain-containing protein [Faecalibacterium sp.]
MKTMAQTMIDADHFYTIAAASGNVVQAVTGAENGGDIRLGKYEHKPEQEWAFIREGDGVYRIRNRANGKLIDLMMTGTVNGTWLHLWEAASGTSQMWQMIPTPEGTVRLRSSWASGKCIDTVGLGSDVGAILQIWEETPGQDQLWTISEVKDRVKRAAKIEETAPAVATEAPKAEEAAPAVAAEAPKAEEAAAPAVVAEAPKAEGAAPAVAAEAPKAEAAAPVAKIEKAAAKPAAKKTSKRASSKCKKGSKAK